MNITGIYTKKVTNEKGECEITITLPYFQEISLEKEKLYRIAFNEIKSKRTLEQNALMWSLIHEIAVARSGERANDDWEIYIEALERAGARFEYIASLPEAEEMLKSQFRAIKLMNKFLHNGKLFNQYKVFYGSSKLDKKEMGLLLQTVMDMASEEGIEIVDFAHE